MWTELVDSEFVCSWLGPSRGPRLGCGSPTASLPVHGVWGSGSWIPAGPNSSRRRRRSSGGFRCASIGEFLASAQRLAKSRQVLPRLCSGENAVGGLCVSPWTQTALKNPPGFSSLSWTQLSAAGPFLGNKQMIGEYSVIIKSPQDTGPHGNAIVWATVMDKWGGKKVNEHLFVKSCSRASHPPHVLICCLLTSEITETRQSCLVNGLGTMELPLVWHLPADNKHLTVEMRSGKSNWISDWQTPHFTNHVSCTFFGKYVVSP